MSKEEKKTINMTLKIPVELEMKISMARKISPDLKIPSRHKWIIEAIEQRLKKELGDRY